jgi:hypothetical protein
MVVSPRSAFPATIYPRLSRLAAISRATAFSSSAIKILSLGILPLYLSSALKKIPACVAVFIYHPQQAVQLTKGL